MTTARPRLLATGAIGPFPASVVVYPPKRIRVYGRRLHVPEDPNWEWYRLWLPYTVVVNCQSQLWMRAATTKISSLDDTVSTLAWPNTWPSGEMCYLYDRDSLRLHERVLAEYRQHPDPLRQNLFFFNQYLGAPFTGWDIPNVDGIRFYPPGTPVRPNHHDVHTFLGWWSKLTKAQVLALEFRESTTLAAYLGTLRGLVLT